MLDLRSMRSVASQARSQQRLLQSQSGQPAIKALQAGSAAAAPLSGDNGEAPPAEDVDVLARMSLEQVLRVVAAPPKLEDGEFQADLEVVDVRRQPVPEDEIAEFNKLSVLLHVYNLNEALVKTNEFLAFSNERAAVGGAFHVGVEVHGSEWSYGVYGLCCDPPRSETSHVYQCSVYMGETYLNQMNFAELLVHMCQRWRGTQYDLLGRNCCSFATEFVNALGVGPLPAWVDRLARIMYTGREVARGAAKVTGEAARQAGTLAVHHGRKASSMVHGIITEEIPAMAEAARPHVEVAAKQAWHQSLVVGAATSEFVGQKVEAAQIHAARIVEEFPDRARVFSEQASQAAEAGQEIYLSTIRPQVQRMAVGAWQSIQGGVVQLSEAIAAANVLGDPSAADTPTPSSCSQSPLYFSMGSDVDPLSPVRTGGDLAVYPRPGEVQVARLPVPSHGVNMVPNQSGFGSARQSMLPQAAPAAYAPQPQQQPPLPSQPPQQPFRQQSWQQPRPLQPQGQPQPQVRATLPAQAQLQKPLQAHQSQQQHQSLQLQHRPHLQKPALPQPQQHPQASRQPLQQPLQQPRQQPLQQLQQQQLQRIAPAAGVQGANGLPVRTGVGLAQVIR